MQSKADYVRAAPQSRKHHCHWPGCRKEVPPAMWGCNTHWFKLPKELRTRIFRAFRPGQEVDQQPSLEYLEVAIEVRRWVQKHHPETPDMFGGKS